MYGKLISVGMNYINWSVVVNCYRDAKRYSYPKLNGFCWANFSIGSKSIGSYDYPNADWVLPSSSSRRSTIDMTPNIYTGAYGDDGSRSAKYEIKAIYDKFIGFNAEKCTVELHAYLNASDETCGKTWVKSFNCWFSKS